MGQSTVRLKGITVLDSPSIIQQRAREAVVRKLDRRLNVADIDKVFDRYLRSYITDSDAWNSILNGQLRVDFGYTSRNRNNKTK